MDECYNIEILLKVAFLPESDMSEGSIRELHALCCRYDQWCRVTAEEESRQWDTLGDKFYARAMQWGKSHLILSDVPDTITHNLHVTTI